MNTISPITAPQTYAPVSPGKSAQSVGHLAKTAVADARAEGAELPRNAQGLAASQIARGADPASIFAGIIAAQMPVEPVAPPVDQAIDAYGAATGAIDDAQDDTATPASDPVADATLAGATDDQLALALLEQAAGDDTAVL